ncbi:MAG TPA: radical SAM protein [Spirochaetales bacterium]|nr:radical SAM protein [Spirochaetales bacterium]
MRPPEPPYPGHSVSDFGNPSWESASPRILIVRLSPFRDVERSAPHLFLFRELRGVLGGNQLYIDFCFLPDARERARRDREKLPWMLGVASVCPALDFDVLLISNAYTLELVNLTPMLERSGIPHCRSKRMNGNYPVIALGGSNAMAAGAIIDHNKKLAGDCGVEAIADCMFFGEGEGRAGQLGYTLSVLAKSKGQKRNEMLAELAGSMDGLWVAARPLAVQRAKAMGLSFPSTLPPLINGAEATTARLEISLGCPSFCSFCFESWERKPYRERSLTDIRTQARELKKAGVQNVELASYNFNAHQDIVRIVLELNRMFDKVNAMSQRADLLANTPGLAKFESIAGKQSFTLGVEGVSQRMRAYYSKDLDEATILKAARAVLECGAREIALFYIFSGFETKEDMAELRSFCAKLAALLKAVPRPPRIILSSGALVRMPYTPLAWEALKIDPADYEDINTALENAARDYSWDYRGPDDWDAYRLSQVLALAPVGSFELLEMLAETDTVFDLHLSKGSWERARKFLDAHSMLGSSFIQSKAKDYPFAMPWLVSASDTDFAWERFLAAKDAKEEGSCFQALCMACGACTDNSERNFLSTHRIQPAGFAQLQELAAIMETKRKPLYRYARLWLSQQESCAHQQYASRMVMAGCMEKLAAIDATLSDSLFRAEDIFLQSDDVRNRLPGAFGETWYRLAFTSQLNDSIALQLGWVENPPIVDSIRVRIDCPGSSPTTLTEVVGTFLEHARLPATMRRISDESVFALADKARKRRNVLTACVKPSAEGSVAELVCGQKFDLELFAKVAKEKNVRYTLCVQIQDA